MNQNGTHYYLHKLTSGWQIIKRATFKTEGYEQNIDVVVADKIASKEEAELLYMKNFDRPYTYLKGIE